MADAPEAPTEQVQLPASNPRSEAIALATAEMERPEATVEGTAPASEPESPPEVTPPDPAPVDERLPKDEVDRLLARQRASMKAELDQARAFTERQNLLAELDALEEEDPDGWTKRVKEDPMAAAAVAERANSVAPQVIARAKTEVVMDQARMLLEARPDIAQLIEQEPEQWQEANNPQTGGIFGYIHRTAMEQGKTEGVESFRKSAEFKKLIEDAERRGAHNALGGIDSPPPSEEGQVVGTPERKFTNPRQAAVAEAARTFRAAGRPISIDPSAVGTRRRTS